jgi:hypothetical protein
LHEINLNCYLKIQLFEKRVLFFRDITTFN